MHLSIYELIALPVGGKLAELLEGQLGNDFRAHRLIIPPRGWRLHWFVCVRPHKPGQPLCHRVPSVAGSGFFTVARKHDNIRTYINEKTKKQCGADLLRK